MNSKPLVSVIMPFFNSEKFIQEAIESVLSQTYDNWELFLMDDGSTDRSTEIALRYTKQYPQRVHYFDHDHHANLGISATRNAGMKKAKGDYIAFLDSDDIWFPQKIERQVSILESQPEAGTVFGLSQYYYSWTGKPEDKERDYIPEPGIKLNMLYPPFSLLTLLYPLAKGFSPCTTSILFRRGIFKNTGGFEKTFQGKAVLYEDQSFIVKLYLASSVFVADECWDRYRIHKNSCVSTETQAGNYYIARRYFLNWLEKYLSKRGFENTRVWHVLQEQLRPYRQITYPLHPIFYHLLKGTRFIGRLFTHKDTTAAYEGYHDAADCNTISGWAWDRNKPAKPVCVDIFDGNDLLAVLKANKFRKDLFDAEKGNGRYAFCCSVPAQLKDGKPHSIRVRISGTNYDLIATPKEINCKGDRTDEYSGNFFENALKLAENNIQTIPFIGRIIAQLHGYEYDPPEGSVQFGDLRRIYPISRVWGIDRGKPIDRYYIENFLSDNAKDIRGHVLEIGDDIYTRRLGGLNVTKSSVLNVTGDNPKTTIIADLSNAPHVKSDLFHCIICTQTLQYIYDVKAAIRTLYRLLKPDGVLLATFPGITQTGDHEWGDCWYWNFTVLSAGRLFEEVFPAAEIKVEAYGNVLAANAFLYGLAAEELQKTELDYRDPGYTMTITVRAVKTGKA
jgi:glycosyltransferase involved in cell wall biosynthesis/SAM-dependent methyltransferase